MSAKYIKRFVALDGNPPPDILPGSLFTGETRGHVFLISCRRGGQPLSLSGAITAEFVNAYEETLPLVGSIVDGVATLPLTAGCYHVNGRFRLTIYQSQSGNISAIYHAQGKVSVSGTDTAYDPSGVIPSLSELLAEVAAMRAATADAEAAATKSVRYDATQSLTEAQKTQARVNIGAANLGDVSSMLASITESETVDLSNTAYYSVLISSASDTWQTGTNRRCRIFPVKSGALSCTITGNATNGSSYAFLTTNAHTDDSAPDYCAGTGRTFIPAGQTVTVSIPAGCQYIYLLDYYPADTSYLPTSFQFRLYANPETRYVSFSGEQSLTAAQKGQARDNIGAAGKAEVEAVQATLEETLLIPNEFDLSTYVYSAYINSSGQWATPQASKSCIAPIPPGALNVTITADDESIASCAFLTDNSHSSGNTPNYAEGTTRFSIPAGTTQTYTIPDDAAYIYILKISSSGNVFTPDCVSFLAPRLIPEIDNTLTQTGQAADAKTTGDEISAIKADVDALEETFRVSKEIDLSRNVYSAYINTSGNWATPAASKSCIVPIPSEALSVTITADDGVATSCAFLKDASHVAGNAPNYAEGTTRFSTPAGTTQTYSIPIDAKYIYILKISSSGSVFTPESVLFAEARAIPEVDPTLTQSGHAADAKVVGDKLSKIIPVSMAYAYNGGSYIRYSDGQTATGTNFAYTDYISVEGISQIIYTRIFVAAQYTPQHGIAFYDENKEFITGSGIRSIAKGNSSGYETFTTAVPEGAVYVRCSMWSNTFSETYNIAPFFIISKDDYDATLTSRVENSNGSYSHMAILHAVPQSAGVQNAILTARQFTDILWTPVEDMPGIIYSESAYVYRTHKKGCRQKGIPYGSGLTYSQMVGDTISFDAFATAVKNPGSVLYTNSAFVEGGKKASYYGVACSKLVQACWGAPELVDSQKIYQLPGITKIANPGEFTFDDIQLGDGVLNPNVHCTIVTDIIRSAVTLEVVGVEISEAVTPTCRRLVWSKSEFDKHFGSYGLYRYAYIDDAKYRKARYIDLEDGYEGVNDVPVGIRRGSFVNMPQSSSYKADVDNTKWTTLHDIVNGVEETSQISSDEISIPKGRTGYHEIFPTDANGARGNSSYYFVYTLSVSGVVSGGNVTVSYTITEGAKPWVIVFDPYHYTFVTTDTGTIIEEIPSGMTSCYVLFKSDYGAIKSATISL